ncbi:hypothetical protein CEXT_129701 [Caerostris extrusa]|uniref:Solute carrier family 46 member 3 n=1 Tax=Caerostris extrusa TaxID=172846 RepID=A0AAV4N1B1_CAEEX|nr:hypothetical protein CEXT_129701 [Caerostris extrusa]
MIASIMMASTGSNEDLLWWSMGLLGLSTAPIYAATIARLNTQVMINGKVLGCLFAASTITILTSDFWLDVMITNYTEAPIYFIILSPILYAIVFAIQLSLFKLERDEEEAFLQPSEEDFSSLNSSKTDVVDVSSVQDNSSTPKCF